MKTLKLFLCYVLLLIAPSVSYALPMFHANINTAQVVSPPAVPLGATGNATFELNALFTELSYTIVLSNDLVLSLDPPNETQGNAVTKIHLHFGLPGATGPHVLNVFGLPSEDDDDLLINYATNTLSGIWGDLGDVIGDPNSPGSTKTLASFLPELLGNQLYVAVHTVNAGGNVELRGQIERIPEPGVLFLILAGAMGLVTVKRRSA